MPYGGSFPLLVSRCWLHHHRLLPAHGPGPLHERRIPQRLRDGRPRGQVASNRPASPDLPGHARREREQAQWDLCRAIR